MFIWLAYYYKKIMYAIFAYGSFSVVLRILSLDKYIIFVYYIILHGIRRIRKCSAW